MRLRLLTFLVIALFLFTASTTFASAIWNVSIDTSSLNNDSGYLYFQYDPGIGAAPTTATISGFTTDGTLGLMGAGAFSNPGFTDDSGYYVTGNLPGDVVFQNTNGINDYNQAFAFGNSISFHVLFSDPVVGYPAWGASTFSLGFYADEYGATPLAGGVMADWTNGGAVVTTPEPGTFCLIGPALLGIFGLRKRFSI